MFFLYSLLYTSTFLLMLPVFILRREKYASGFWQRIGNYPEFHSDGWPAIWLHCVSVGETNAARPLVEALKDRFPDHRLIISTTTYTGQQLARNTFNDKADAIIYFPFDWKFCVRRAIRNYEPSIVLLMETEIWPRFIHEAKSSGAAVAIVNGRLSQRSFARYSTIRSFVRRVLRDVDLALMQHDVDAERIGKLGIDPAKIKVTGNLKFDSFSAGRDFAIAAELRDRFGISHEVPLIVAASTHEPEEKHILSTLTTLPDDIRLMIAPRHPQRFDAVAETVRNSGLSVARRSAREDDTDKAAKVILLDSIGELRGAYQLADIVFVGGSLIPHGGQSILEPSAAGKAIVTGPFTQNFEAAISELKRREAIIQLSPYGDQPTLLKELSGRLADLLKDAGLRKRLGENALQAMKENEGAARKTVDILSGALSGQ